MFKKAFFAIFLMVEVGGQQSNETSSTYSVPTTLSTTSPQIITSTTPSTVEAIKSYSSGLTPQLMHLLDDSVEGDATESIFPFEKMNVVAFPRINIQPNIEEPSPEDSLKIEQQKLETFLQHIATNSDSFGTPKNLYGSLGKLHDEEIQVQPPSMLNDAKFFTSPKPVQIPAPSPNFRNYPPYFNNGQPSAQQQNMLPLVQDEFMVPRYPPCPFQALPSFQPNQPLCCANHLPNHCGPMLSNHPSEIQLPGGLGTITEKDVDDFVDNLLERNLQRQQTKRLDQSPHQDNNYEGMYNNKYFAVPSNSQNFHSPPKGFGASVALKSTEKSEERPAASENEAKKEEFNPNFKFFYQFGDGNINESKTALYHVNQLKTKQPTVISLRPSTENLLKMLNSHSHGLHMVEVPFEEDLEEDESSKETDNKAN